MSRQGRRSFLAAAGTGLAGALAGCSDLNPLSGESRVEYDESALAALPGDLPGIPAAEPVVPSRDHVAAARERVRSLLEGDVARVPNGAVRYRLASEREAARTALESDDGDTDAETRVDALAGLTHPRSEAMFVHAGLAAFDGELDESAVAARRERHHREAAAVLDDYRYVGPPDDPVGALAEHARIAEWAQAGARLTASAGDHAEYENAVLHVAELAADVEWGRAYAADARRLRERYVATLDGGADYGSRFARAAETLAGDVESHADAPDWAALTSGFERDVEGTAARRLLEDLASARWIGAQSAVEDDTAGRHASAVVSAMRALAADRALAAAETAVSEGAYGVPDSVERIAAERADAVDGLRDVLDTAPAPLAYRLAVSVRTNVRNADRHVREGYVSEPGRGIYAQYATANHLAGASPAVVERVARELDA